MSGDSSGRPKAGWLRPLLSIVLVGIFAGLLSFIGCGRSTESVTTPKPNGKSTAGSDLLNAAVNMMQPEQLGINAQPQQAAGLLNQWRKTQLEIDEAERLSQPPSEETRVFLETHLPGETLDRTERDDFTIDDVKHVRTSRLMKTIVDHVAKGVDGEVGRAQVVFDFVTRNVDLVSEDNALPLMPYEILMFGRGTAADRAWVFSELLRQLNQDAVIVRPDSSDPAAPWFVAAVANKQLFLFDPLRSTAVPRSDGDEGVPATLSDLSNPRVWEALTGENRAPFSPEAWENVRVELIGTSTLWAPRNAKLQSVLSGDDSIVIYQKLAGAAGDSSAILNRISDLKYADGGKLKVDAWSFPESRLAAYQAAKTLDAEWKPFLAPVPIKIDTESGQIIIGNPSRGLMKTRTQQLVGDFDEAIRSYFRIRLAARDIPASVSTDLRDMHADAADDAYFWAGVCQMEQESAADAARKFGQYVSEAEKFTTSRHADHARILMGRCLAQIGRIEDALAAIEPLKPASPEYAAATYFQRQWEAALSSAKPAAAEKPASQ